MPKRSAKKAQRRVQGRLIAEGRIARPGRPKLVGVSRYPCGRPRPPAPNERVVADRRLLLGSPEAKGAALRSAENPLDLMMARGWLTKELLEAATTFGRLYKAAFPALPDLKSANIAEEPTRDGEKAVNRAPRQIPNPDGNPAAMTTLRAIWRVLAVKPGARREVIELCLLAGSWPTWLVGMIEQRNLTGEEQAARRAFFWGLHNINAVLARPHVRAPAVES